MGIKAILLISCPDQKGITAEVTNFVFKNGGNILHAEQHTDEQVKAFFMRIAWSLDGFSVAREKVGDIFMPIAEKYKMKWDIYFSDDKPRVAIFVSKRLHCLYDIFLRHRGGQFYCDIPLVISNHPDAGKVASEFGAVFYEFTINGENKAIQEEKQIKLIQDEKIDLIVLARYHQILTSNFVDLYRNRIINIHHSFLPAFPGRDPYSRAYMKGVKIIGATSHYVTEDLDEGPIIEQDTARISHRDAVDDLIRTGEDLEKIVLSKAVRWHIERKILVYNNKTVIFE